ncbi:uncharacterized protein [Henckelia pumila]|uniref:uncharacterized protein n=1 Tax=Henckelia pumila TaxID=405737 RepID=UPI003C6E479A
MDSSNTANSFLKHLVLDGTNYSLWKTRMRFTRKSMDECAWQSILTGWTAPKLVDKDGDYIIKPETTWTIKETQLSSFNAKAINAIFSSVDIKMFGLIAYCVVAKDAWDTLQEPCKGSESVKRTRMRLLNSNFENLCMSKEETISEYDQRLRELVTEAYTLGELIANERLVNKVLRSLPERFNGKIWALEEVKDTSKMKLTELISILQVFEMNNTAQKKDKGKEIALQTSDESYEEYVQFRQNVLQSDLGEDTISLMTKKFNEYLRRMKEAQNYATDTVQFHACQGFGHYANECANTLRLGMNMSLSDEESEEDEEQEDEESHTALSALLESKKFFQINSLGVAAGDGTLTMEEALKMYEELYVDWIERNKLNTILSKENTDLKAVVSRLEVMLRKKDLEVCKLKEKLGKAKATLAKFNSSTTKFDSLLMMGRDGTASLGFENSSWYFDSGSSRHMAGSKKFLTDYVEHKSGKITYGGGSKGNIVLGHPTTAINLDKRWLVDTQK